MHLLNLLENLRARYGRINPKKVKILTDGGYNNVGITLAFERDESVDEAMVREADAHRAEEQTQRTLAVDIKETEDRLRLLKAQLPTGK